MQNFWWHYFLIFLLGRTTEILILYLSDTPYGTPLVENWTRFIPHSMLIEIGVIGSFTFIFAFLSGLNKTKKFIKPLSIFCAAIYLFLSALDGEVMRWMGQRLTISFLQTYYMAFSDTALSLKIFKGGLFHFCLDIVIAALFVFLTYKCKKILFLNRKNFLLLLLSLLLISVAGLTSKYWFHPSKSRWARMKPIVFVFGDEILNLYTKVKPQNYDEGISLMGGQHIEFPFYKIQENEKQSFENFLSLKDDEKPNIFILVIESFRGDYGDIRTQNNCLLIPNLCSFAEESTFFPYAYSVGSPSIEGFLGIQVGIWSHPAKRFLNERANTRIRSLPSILGEAGYRRIILTGADPSFDNLWGWFEKFFDYAEYDKKINNDIPLANRFSALLSEHSQSAPLYFVWMSTTMHSPFVLPQGDYSWEKRGYFTADPPQENIHERYKQTLHYTDSAIGIVLNAIKNLPKKNNLIIITGDHSHNLGDPNADKAFNFWVPLWYKRSLQKDYGLVFEKKVSHADIAPTILDELNLKVSNCFVGENLFGETHKNAFSFINGEVIVHQNDSAKIDSAQMQTIIDTWRYVADNNKLMP